MEEENAHGALNAIDGGDHVCVGFFDQHDERSGFSARLLSMGLNSRGRYCFMTAVIILKLNTDLPRGGGCQGCRGRYI